MTANTRFRFLGFVLVALGCAGGNTNMDAASDQSKVDMCESISTEYETALMKAEECTLEASHQCTQTGIASFFCSCHTVVNGDTANLAAIGARYDAAGCMRVCIGTCVNETAASCQPDSTSSTGGRCLPLRSDSGT